MSADVDMRGGHLPWRRCVVMIRDAKGRHCNCAEDRSCAFVVSRTRFVLALDFADEENEMANENGAWTRQGEVFWRAHHEAWKRSDLNQRQYCEFHGLPQKAFENWRQKFRREPDLPQRKLLYRRRGLSHTLSHNLNHPRSHTLKSWGLSLLRPCRSATTRGSSAAVQRGRQAWDSGSGRAAWRQRLGRGAPLWHRPPVTTSCRKLSRWYATTCAAVQNLFRRRALPYFPYIPTRIRLRVDRP
jgi:hypothetical protein